MKVQDVGVNYWTYSRRGDACGEDVNPRCRDISSAIDQALNKAAITVYRALGNGLCVEHKELKLQVDHDALSLAVLVLIFVQRPRWTRLRGRATKSQEHQGQQIASAMRV